MISIKDIVDAYATTVKVVQERLNSRLVSPSRNMNNSGAGLNLPDAFYSPFVNHNGKLLKIFTFGISEYSKESEDVVVPSGLPRSATKRYLLINSEDI